MLNSYRAINTFKVFDDVPFTNGQVLQSDIITLRDIAKQGYFSVEYNITGGGTADLDYLARSVTDGTFINPADATIIENNAVGHGFQSFGPMLTPYIKIQATFTNSGRITLYLNVG